MTEPISEPDGADTDRGQQRAETAGQPTVGIVGIGNEIMGDDGVGPHVVRRLEETALAESDAVDIVNAGTTGFFALEAMSGCDRAIVVDAIQTGDPPGTVHEYRCVEGTFEGKAPEMTMHDISFTEALAYSREVYDLPDEIRIVGIEPAAVEPSTEVSEELEATIHDVIEMVTTHVNRVMADGSTAGRDSGSPADEPAAAHDSESMGDTNSEEET